MADRKFTVPSGLFGRINETRAAGGTRVFERPMHVLERIDEVRVEERRGGKGSAVAILKTVLYVFTDSPTSWSGGRKGQVVPLPTVRVGEQYTEYFPLVEDWAWPQLKTAVGTFFGVDPDSVTSEHLDLATGESQPCNGIIVESRKIERESNKSNVVYTRCGYVRPWTATEIASQIGDCPESIKQYGGAEKLTADVEAEATKKS